MLKKLAFTFGIATVALVAGCPLMVRSASTVSQNFLLTSPGATTVLSFSGQLQCEVQVNGPNQSIASTPQYSADGVTWVPASNINRGSITAPGTYISTSQPASYSSLRLVVSSFSGSQLSGALVCGDSLPAGGGAGGVASVSGAPPITSTGGQNPVVGLNIGFCLASDGVNLIYNCSTPGPQETPSPTASTGISITGTFPYTIANSATPTPFPTPSPLATSTAGAPSAIWTTAAGNPQLSINFPTGGASTPTFPFAFKQNAAYNAGQGTTVSATLGSSATASDFLLAIITYSNFSSGTITTPSGWTQVLVINASGGGNGWVVYSKTAAGGETGISVSKSRSDWWTCAVIEFNGARTVDKTATGIQTGSLFTVVPPSLTSPTSGAGVIVGVANDNSQSAFASLVSADGTGASRTSWAISPQIGSVTTSVFDSAAIGFWQGTVGTNTLTYPAFIFPGSGNTQEFSLSLL